MDYLIYYYCTDENQYKKYLFSLVSLLNFIFKLFLLTVSIFLVEQAKDSIIPKIFLLSLLIKMKKALWAKTSSDSAFSVSDLSDHTLNKKNLDTSKSLFLFPFFNTQFNIVKKCNHLIPMLRIFYATVILALHLTQMISN